jgi:membrane-bound metal-dependent hydrolase YbcI (DUF457 family)
LHFGINGSVALLAGKRVDFLSCVIANIVIDIEPFLALIVGLNIPVHGISHTFLGGLVITIVFFIPFGIICNQFRTTKKNLWSYLLGGIVGMFLHILFDSLIHRDVRPLFPFSDTSFTINGIGPYVIPIWVGGYILLVVIFLLKRYKGKIWGL